MARIALVLVIIVAAVGLLMAVTTFGSAIGLPGFVAVPIAGVGISVLARLMLRAFR